MHTTKNYGGLDRFRLGAALLVIAIHTSPLASLNESADFFLTRILARIAVPFFFMLTGQFVVTRFLNPSGRELSGTENPSGRNLSGADLPAAEDSADKVSEKETTEAGFSALKSFLKKMVPLYVFCILLYLPVGLYAGHYQKLNPGTVLRMLLFDGTFYHLWYFPACIIGVLLVYLMSRFLSLRSMTAVSGVLYVIGLLGDSYYGLIQKVPFLESVYDFIFQAFSYTRNGLFLAPIFLVLGTWAGKTAEKAKSGTDRQEFMADCIGLLFSFAIMSGEAFLLRHFDFQRHDSMYLMLIPTMYFLYQCLLAPKGESLKSLRIVSAWIYILHPGMIVVVRAAAKPLNLTALLVENNLVHYLAVTLLSVLAGALLAFLQLRFPLRSMLSHKSREQKIGEVCDLIDREEQSRQMPESEEYEPDAAVPDAAAPETAKNTNLSSKVLTPFTKSAGKRAWIELDPAALEQNVAFLRSLLPERCRLMPAVKAEAYGHGGVIIARLLNDMGINAFCVACIAEGIALREAGIKGGILILGYTSPEDFHLLHRYHLTQTVVDYDHAKQMNRFKNTLHVHLAIDTGMHRLGIRCENLEEIESVCKMTNLSVDGFFTHLSVSDSVLQQDILFTEAQIKAFYQVIRFLRKKGYTCRGLHLLASYGILNLLSGREPQEVPDQESAKPPVTDRQPADLYAAEYRPENGETPVNTGAEAKPRILSAANLAADYVRPGIALYGVLSNSPDSNAWRNFLRPVLSLKATVASIRPLYAGEAAGYGAAFTAKRDMRIAVVSIGYADGLPRELSYGKGSVLINGYRAPILGRVCMDQTIVDVSRIPRIQAGDTAVIIGKSGKLENTADSVAAQCGTITNELLSRLGGRLDRVVHPLELL